jgi:hypothetical protein
MKKPSMTIVALATLVTCVASAQTTIRIEIAEVQNGVVFVKGTGATSGAPITWEGNLVTTANRNKGGFSFNGTVPADCIGTLSDGVSTGTVQILGCTPISGGFLPLPRTGQTTSYVAGDDGALQKGLAPPTPRFTDNANGTITDNLSGLIWLKNATCFGLQNWFEALADALGLESAQCGLSDGSVAGDWRLPNVRELQSLVDYGRDEPAMPEGHPFQLGNLKFWSSTSVKSSGFSGTPDFVWVQFFLNGGETVRGYKDCSFLGSCPMVMAVRGGS